MKALKTHDGSMRGVIQGELADHQKRYVTFGVASSYGRAIRQSTNAGSGMRACEASQGLRVYEALSYVGLRLICPKDYSYLNATMGSTRMARRAGI